MCEIILRTIDEFRKQTIKAIEIRKATGLKKIEMILALDQHPDARFIKETYYLSDAALEERLVKLNEKYDQTIDMININDIL